MSEPLIVIVEDDATIAELIEFNLRNDGYDTRSFGDGHSMLAALPQLMPVALFVLDVMLPGIDGFQILARLKADPATVDIPVFMLTARSTESDKVRGLTGGADDYLAKPFGIREFLARIAAILRRANRPAAHPESPDRGLLPESGSEAATASAGATSGSTIDFASSSGSAGSRTDLDGTIRYGPICIDDARHRVFRDDHEIEMTHREYELLKHLMLHRGIAYSRDELLNAVWGYDYYGETRTVDVHIRQLRRKIETDDANPTLIETVRGRGYRFADRPAGSTDQAGTLAGSAGDHTGAEAGSANHTDSAAGSAGPRLDRPAGSRS